MTTALYCFLTYLIGFIVGFTVSELDWKAKNDN